MSEGGRWGLWMKTVGDGMERKIGVEDENKRTDNNNTANQIKLLCAYLYYMCI